MQLSLRKIYSVFVTITQPTFHGRANVGTIGPEAWALMGLSMGSMSALFEFLKHRTQQQTHEWQIPKANTVPTLALP